MMRMMMIYLEVVVDLHPPNYTASRVGGGEGVPMQRKLMALGGSVRPDYRAGAHPAGFPHPSVLLPPAREPKDS